MINKSRGNINMILIGAFLLIAGLVLHTIGFKMHYGWLLIFPLFLIGGLLLGLGVYFMYKDQSMKGENVVCPHCGHTYKLPAGAKSFDCPLCHKHILVATSEKTGKRKAFVAPE